MKLSSMAASVSALLASSSLLAQETPGIDQRIEQAVAPVTQAVSAAIFYSVPVNGADLPLIVVWLIAAAVFCTFYFGFINIRGFKQGFKLIRGDFNDPTAPGDVTHFQALSTAVSGTVGLGNIAGVSIAVALGGPGATFWMVVAGLLGMSSKFCECTLGVKYRKIAADGTISGGPMYYLSTGIAENYPSLAGVGKVLAVVFAFCAIGGSFGGGNMFQANQSYQQFVSVTGGSASWFADKGWLFGLILAGLTGVVIIGGIRSIARVTSKLVPLMGIVYVAAALVILAMNFSAIPSAFGAIFDGAFSPQGVTGGFIGVLVMGFRRATFSNEAGVGSAAIAHSVAKTRHPVTEGLVALWEPFIDTVVVCTMTALVIIITGFAKDPGDLDGVQLASGAFGSAISWFPYVLAVAVFLFAFSTMISWSFYGLKAATYLFGESRKVDLIYKLMFLTLTVIGCTMQLGAVTDLSDALIFIMALPNVIGIYLLAPVVKRELVAYLKGVEDGSIHTS